MEIFFNICDLAWWLILPKIPTNAGALCRWRAKAWVGTASPNGEPSRFPVSLISVRRSVTPAISPVIDHVSARALLYSPHLLERHREVLLSTFIGGKEFFFPFPFQAKTGSREREEKTRRETRHTLIRQGFQLLLFHLSGFISALILDFRTPSHILKSGRFHSLGGQDYSNKTVSCSSSNITTCSF